MFFGEINNVNAQLVLEIYIASFFLSYPIFDRKKGFIWKYLLLTVVFITLGYFFQPIGTLTPSSLPFIGHSCTELFFYSLFRHCFFALR